MQTAMSVAMKRAGFNATEATFNVAIARFRNNGGSEERAIELICAAYETPDEGRLISAEPGKEGERQDGPELLRQSGLRSSARSAREPNKIAISAMVRAKEASAKAIFAVNGIDIRQFTIGACLSEGKRKGKEHYILSVIGGMYKHLPHTMHVHELMGDDELTKLVRQAEAYANAA